MDVTAPDWKRVRAILEHASELLGAAREEYLERECGGDVELRREVDGLLALDAPQGAMDPPSAQAVLQAFAASSRAPQRIGAWRLEREIARGGMGAVWLAHRVDGGFSQRAAIKLIKRGMDSDEIVARFERERALLASLEHPGIARLYDGGSTDDGQPYLVMEFVEGVPLDEYCARPTTTLAQRLELFAEVCDAVQHAHQQLVVHRDLKPSNVLVTAEGQPKLLDFGIAKLLTPDEAGAALTATAQRFLTPAYASPEQLRGDPISTRSDVFSLGVMLYEMLALKRPFDAKRAPDTEPAPPSRAAATRAFVGDLDTIVMKALSVDPARRYASAEALASDVRRHLAGAPVQARPDTWTYRASKFVRRNRALVAATLTVIAGLTVGIVLAYLQSVEAERARELADRRLASVVNLASAFSSKLTARLGQLEGVLPEREGLLRDMAEQLEQLVAQAPDDFPLRLELGWARRELALVLGAPNQPSAGKFDEALRLLDRSIGDVEALHREQPGHVDAVNLLAAMRSERGELLAHAGRRDDARREMRAAAELAHKTREGLDPDRDRGLLLRECNVLHALFSVERESGRRDAENELALEYMQLVEFAVERHPDDEKFRYLLATALVDRAGSAEQLGDSPSALKDLERATEILAELSKADGLNVVYRRAFAATEYRMGGTLATLDQVERAVDVSYRAWQAWEAVVRAEPADIAARDRLLQFSYAAGSVARQSSRLDIAKPALERSLEILDERMARYPEQRGLLMTRATLGSELAAVLAELGEWRGALELAQDSVAQGMQLENDAAAGHEWNYAMSLSHANLAECSLFTARDSDAPVPERRGELDAAQRSIARAREFLQAADAAGQIGAAERQHFGYLDELDAKASSIRDSLPDS